MKRFSFIIVFVFLGCSPAINYPLLKSSDFQRLTDGLYTGKYHHKMERAKVQVKVESGKITMVEILDVNAFSWRHEEVISKIPGQIITAQSLDVDGISGATGSVNAVKKAVSEALKNAVH